MCITISRLSDKQLDELSVSSWPVWEKEVSVFDWYYNETEECYILDGEAEVETEQKNTS